jgi:predicted HicB family RNase H-like nuclease
MTEQLQTSKVITVRLPESLWDQLTIAAHHRRISLNKAAIRGLCLVLEVDPPEAAPDEQTEAA